jgi:hypothetical protein
MHNVALLFLLAIPLIGSVVVFGLPEGRDLLAKQVTLAASVATFVYAIVLSFGFKTTVDPKVHNLLPRGTPSTRLLTRKSRRGQMALPAHPGRTSACC